MPKSFGQKQKLLRVKDILEQETDRDHPITIGALCQRLAAYGISAERKSLYDDFAALMDYGLDIVKTRIGKQTGYYVESRVFEMPELKLLVDAVQSSRFITKRKSDRLIEKLSGFVSRGEARTLRRQVYITNRIKAENEAVYYAVDDLHNAINQNKQVSFEYFSWNLQKEKVLRHGGARYRVSPWALIWDDEYYYLVAYDPTNNQLRHYRVDKMQKVRLVAMPREGKALFESYDPVTYSQRMFGMFGGEEQLVTLRVENSLVDVILDRFGTDVTLIPRANETFEVTARVAVSPNFLAWVIGFGKRMRVVAPKAVAESVATLARAALE